MAKTIKGSVPVWLGTVSPLPVGYVYNGTAAVGTVIPAGTPVAYIDKSSSNSATFKEVSSAADITTPAADTKFGYLYNDVEIKDYDNGTGITGAVVVAHPEGILINRVCASDIAAAMATACPGVVQVVY